MNRDLRNIGFNGIIYIISAFFSKGLNILLLPIYTSFLSVQEYGEVSLLVLFRSIMISILGLGQIVTIKKAYYDYEIGGRDFRPFFSTLLLGTFIIDLFIVLFFSFIGSYVFEEFFEGLDFWFVGFLILTSSILIVPYQLLLKLYQTRNQSIKFSLFEISLLGSEALISLFFIIILPLGTLGRVLGILVSTVSLFLITLYFIKKEVRVSFNKEVFKRNLKIGIPVIPHSLSAFVLNLSDRIFLNKTQGGLETVGVYSLGYQIAQITDIVSLAFIEAWSSYFMKYANKVNEYSKIIAKFSLYYVIITLVFSAVLSLFAKEIISIFFNESYIRAAGIIPIVILGYSIKNLYYLSNQQLIYKEKTNLLFASTGISALINLILNYLLIIKMDMGMYGAAFSTIASLIIMSIISFINGQKLFHIPYYTKKMAVLYFTFILLITSIYLVNNWNYSIVSKLGILLLFILIILIVIPKEDLQYSRKLINKLLTKRG